MSVQTPADPSTTRRVLAIAIAALALAGARAPQTGLKFERLDILTRRGVAHFTVQMADTPASREKGLMFVRSLGPDKGMLFNFKFVQPVSFWMKNTLIPLDMLFIAADGRVVTIASNAVPMSQTPIPSGEPVLGVLEIAGGRAAQLGLAPGDRVKARIFHP